MCDTEHHNRPFRHWIRHFAAVPKGFLRYYVLKLLNEKPMTGSEIMDEIEKRTKGHWKPSPGSIYPLMAWLQDNGYVKEAPEQEAGMKRYILTERGKEFLEEHVKKRDELREKFMFFMPPFPMPPPLELPWLDFYPQKMKELVEALGALKKLAKALWNLRDSLREKYSEKAVAETREVIERATREIEEIVKKLKEQESENARD